jgi:hypothetical protein
VSDAEDADELSKWNHRKCCAATLDLMSLSLQGHMLEPLMPLIGPSISRPCEDYKSQWRTVFKKKQKNSNILSGTTWRAPS